MDIKLELDVLFGKIFSFNSNLLHQCNEIKDEYDPIKVMDFYLSSHAMDIVKTLYFSGELLCSVGLFDNARNFLEGIAFKRHLQSKDFKDINNKLFQKQFFILEYKSYKKMFDYDENLLIKDKIIDDYKCTVKYYTELLKDTYTNTQINAIINSSFPCMCSPYFDTRNLIEKYLNEEEIKVYSNLSWYVHPGTNNFYRKDNWENLFEPIIDLLFKEFYQLPKGEHLLSTWNAIATSDISTKVTEILTNQADELLKVAEVLKHHYGDNYLSDTFITLRYVIFDLSLDFKLSLTEQIKMKIKTILELLAVTFEYGLDFVLNDKKYQLLLMHEDIKKLVNDSKSFEDQIREAHIIYRCIYENGVEIADFTNNFKRTTGYTIDEDGKCKSLNKLVMDFCKNTAAYELVMMIYRESQILSHANGYLWFSNTGSFQDTLAAFTLIDNGIYLILKKVKDYYDSLNDKNYKDIRNINRNSLKRYNKEELLKQYLMMINKQDLIY